MYAIPQKTIVDGVVRFDINDDAPDMRIDVDPNESIPAFYNYNAGHKHDNCMQDAFEFLFTEEKH